MVDPVVGVYPDLEALSQAAASTFAAAAGEAVATRGRFTLALAGGRTPRRLYELLAGPYRERVPWAHALLFWGDERYVAHADPESNYRMAREAMIDHLPVPAAQVHPMPTHQADPAEAARSYEAILRRRFAGEAFPTFDLALLGMGADGHTASLFPGTAALADRQGWVAVGESPTAPSVRLTLTLPALAAARQVIFLVTGADKAKVVREILSDPRAARLRYPAARVLASGRAYWYLDAAAAALLP